VTAPALIDALPDPGPRGVRYSGRAFPAYRYVPGVHPHPLRDPRGHSYGRRVRPARRAPWSPLAWAQLDDWLYGVDLFNRFYFWEAHEAWETLWAVCPRDGDPARLLQGLIQIAAALLKTHTRNLAGAGKLSRQGLEKLDRVAAAQPSLLGLSVPEVARAFHAYFAPLTAGELPRVGPQIPLLRLRVREQRNRSTR
jgi:hypothetical protein